MAALWAVRAEHEILDNLVAFECTVCTEEFAAFHPAFEPPEELDMQLLKRGQSGVADFDMSVAIWDEMPLRSNNWWQKVKITA